MPEQASRQAVHLVQFQKGARNAYVLLRVGASIETLKPSDLVVRQVGNTLSVLCWVEPEAAAAALAKLRVASEFAIAEVSIAHMEKLRAALPDEIRKSLALEML